MEFEILCLDNEEKVRSRTVKALMHAFLANDNFFEETSLDDKRGIIVDTKGNKKICITQFPTDKISTDARHSVAFTICVSSDRLEVLDPFRVQFVDYIKLLGFSNIRILKDEVSKELATELYPYVYTLENEVRTFIVNFFLKNLGTNWINYVMTDDTIKKIKSRKNNDRIFVEKGKVDSDVILIDFDELGKILYNENSILSNKKADNVTALIDKISKATDLETLKHEVLEGNFYKYFKDCFIQKDFSSKWYELYYYRNKLAHNGTFSREEVDLCIQLCKDISVIIDGAYSKLDTFKLSRSDQEALMFAANEISNEMQENNENSYFVAITESELLSELSAAEKKLPFVGLRYFVVDWLGKKGYDYNASFVLINYMEDKGTIKLSLVESPDADHSTSTISIVKNES